MSQALIHDCWAELGRLKQASGSSLEKFDAYRLADQMKCFVAMQALVVLVAGMARIARVSGETVRLVEALKDGPR